MDSFLKSKTSLKLGLAIANATPPRLGYAIARWVAQLISSRRRSTLVEGIRINQQIVAQGGLDQQGLDRAVSEVLFNTARSFYDLYHQLNELQAASPMFIIEPSFQILTDRPKFDRRGLVVAGIHMAGFDLALQWLCLELIKPLAITIPIPQGGRALEYQRRMEMGVQLVPGNFEGLRKAVRFLKKGGMVVTGIDHPNQVYQPKPRFFGLPAALPTHHIFLALKANCPVVVAASHLETDGLYHLTASSPIELDPYPDREDQLQYNAEKVLTTAEAFIRRNPQQWLIHQPVWEKRIGD